MSFKAFMRRKRPSWFRGRAASGARSAACAAAMLYVAARTIPAPAQYPGHISTQKKPQATLRSIAVLEWTGQPGKPSASRIIPVAVYDGEQYQPGGLYLARPEPLAVESGTEYVLQRAGVSQGLFDVYNAQNVQGYWFGYGSWKPMPAPPRPHKLQRSKITPKLNGGGADDGRPHLVTHGGSGGQNGSGQTSSGSANSDPDRPVLKRRDESSDSSDSGGNNSQNSGAADQNGSANQAPPGASDPDRPTLRRRSSSPASQDASFPGADPSAPETPIGGSDPDRPLLTYNKQNPTDKDFQETKLVGAPANLEEMIAVSDATDREPHPLLFQWADPGDASKMQAQMEALAQKAIVAAEPPKPAKPAPAKKGSATAHPTHPAHPAHSTRKAGGAPPAPPLPALTNESFQAYQLTYNAGATLIFSAQTTGADGPVKYVTLIAQPDFSGVPVPLFQSVTDDAHLDVTPRLRLVDAVDAKANNRGDLVFESRSRHDRQFVIYRVAGGRAEQVFTTGPLSGVGG